MGLARLPGWVKGESVWHWRWQCVVQRGCPVCSFSQPPPAPPVSLSSATGPHCAGPGRPVSWSLSPWPFVSDRKCSLLCLGVCFVFSLILGSMCLVRSLQQPVSGWRGVCAVRGCRRTVPGGPSFPALGKSSRSAAFHGRVVCQFTVCGFAIGSQPSQFSLSVFVHLQ